MSQLKYAIKVEYDDNAGATFVLEWIGTRPWNRDEAGSDHAMHIASQLWKMQEGERITVWQKQLGVKDAAFIHCDGLDF